MTAKLLPYPEYRESGLPWLVRVPAHWEIRRAKYLFRCIDTRTTTGSEELLTVSAERGVVPRSSIKVTMFKAESYVGHKLCWPDDLVINSLWAWGRGLGVSKHHGVISSAYGVYRLRSGFEFYSGFIHHLVRSAAFHWELRVRSKGVWLSRLQLTDDSFLAAPIPLPPRDEAEKIVQFIIVLDHRVNRFIRNRRRLIEVLNEQKQAIINRAVTRGLDPTVPLKPSGIDWLGEIPVHWDARPAKYSLAEVDERSATGTEELLSVSHITGVTPRSQKQITMFMAASYVGHKVCQPNDLVINTMWAWMGALGVAMQVGIVSSSYAVYRPRSPNTIDPRFLDNLLRIAAYRGEYLCRSTGIRLSRMRLYPEQFLKIPLCLPPLREQGKIMEQVKGSTGSLDRGIDRASTEIALIREYRTRLIADVVTGKLDVRHLAHGELPADEGLTDMELAEVDDDQLAPVSDESQLVKETSEE
jgi:type I restriction enzyme S subunit